MVHKIPTLSALIPALPQPLPADANLSVHGKTIHGWQLMSRQGRTDFKSGLLQRQTEEAG